MIKDNIETFYVGIYSRLSVDNNSRKSESVENQIEIVSQYISDNNSNPNRKMNLKIYDIYIDRGITGTSFSRAGFERLMQDVKNHMVTCIIVKDLSRFGRDYLEMGNLIEKILPFLGCRFIAVADNFDSMSESVNEDRLVMNIKNLVNDMYARDISGKVMLAREMSAENGSFVGINSPYGYEIVYVKGLRRLQINRECAKVVRKIYDLYSQGKSFNHICLELYNDRVHSVSDYKKYGHVYCHAGEVLHQWSEGAIRGILKNRSYTGDLIQCKKESGVIIQDTHQAIISREIFEKVQTMFEKKKTDNKCKYSPKNTENIYRNILYCGNCGKIMHTVYNQSRVNGERHYAYFCKGAYRVDKERCQKNYIREEEITAFMQGQLRNILKEKQVGENDLTRLCMKEYDRIISSYKSEEKKICAECGVMRKKAGEKFMHYKEGIISKEEYDIFKKNRKEHDTFAEKRSAELQSIIRATKKKAEEENKRLLSLTGVNSCQKINIYLIESLVEKIVVFPDGTVDIVFRFS